MSEVYEMQNTPTKEQYVHALTALGERVTDEHRTLFRVHYEAPDRTAYSQQLANWAEIPGGHVVVNSRYGKLGHALCDELGIYPDLRPDDTHRWWSVWSRGWRTDRGFVWQMLPRLAEALEKLRWVSPSGPFVLPDEVTSSQGLIEGAARTISVNAYERKTKVRRQCIAAHGQTCSVCGFDFGAFYGEVADGYIHVHHLRQLSEIGQEHEVDPVADLRPVCPNCHAVIHRRTPPFSIAEVREFISSREPPNQALQTDRAPRGG